MGREWLRRHMRCRFSPPQYHSQSRRRLRQESCAVEDYSCARKFSYKRICATGVERLARHCVDAGYGAGIRVAGHVDIGASIDCQRILFATSVSRAPKIARKNQSISRTVQSTNETIGWPAVISGGEAVWSASHSLNGEICRRRLSTERKHFLLGVHCLIPGSLVVTPSRPGEVV